MFSPPSVISSVAPDPSLTKKRQLFARQGSYTIGTSEVLNKELEHRYSIRVSVILVIVMIFNIAVFTENPKKFH